MKFLKVLPKPKRYTNDRAYSIDEIIKICEYNDKRIKPIVYTMVSSGNAYRGLGLFEMVTYYS